MQEEIPHAPSEPSFQSGMRLVTNVDILSGEEAPGKKVIVLGGGMTGLITADFLGQQGCEVHALNRKNRFAEEMSANDRYYLRESIKEKNITLYKKVAIKGFTRDEVTFKTRGETVQYSAPKIIRKIVSRQ